MTCNSLVNFDSLHDTRTTTSTRSKFIYIYISVWWNGNNCQSKQLHETIPIGHMEMDPSSRFSRESCQRSNDLPQCQ